MIACTKPTVTDVIQDPAAGTGGFLVAAQQYIRSNLPKQAKLRRKQPTFLGMEHVQDVHRLALMNQLLHGIPYVNDEMGIQYGDALGPDGARMAQQGASLVLTNPPFGTKEEAVYLRGLTSRVV
jgi:type I restriction enzyme M protein